MRRRKPAKDAAKLRELFVEDLADVKGGKPKDITKDCCYTTLAYCEEITEHLC